MLLPSKSLTFHSAMLRDSFMQVLPERPQWHRQPCLMQSCELTALTSSVKQTPAIHRGRVATMSLKNKMSAMNSVVTTWDDLMLSVPHTWKKQESHTAALWGAVVLCMSWTLMSDVTYNVTMVGLCAGMYSCYSLVTRWICWLMLLSLAGWCIWPSYCSDRFSADLVCGQITTVCLIWDKFDLLSLCAVRGVIQWSMSSMKEAGGKKTFT